MVKYVTMSLRSINTAKGLWGNSPLNTSHIHYSVRALPEHNFYFRFVDIFIFISEVEYAKVLMNKLKW